MDPDLFPVLAHRSSILVLKQDGHVSAHLGKGDQRDLKGLAAGTLRHADDLEATVARSVRRAWAAFARDEIAGAEAALGEEASKAIFRNDPARSAFSRSNVSALRAGVVVMVAQAIFLGGAFSPAERPAVWAPRGRDLSEQDVRARLNAIVALSLNATDWSEKLDGRWTVKLVLPARDWFTPEMCEVIDAQLIRGLERYRLVGTADVPSHQRPVPLHDANGGALYCNLFQRAVVWDLVRTEDLPRFGVSRDGLRHAISELPDERRHALTTLVDEEPVGDIQLELMRVTLVAGWAVSRKAG